jgi:hypothetical protein
MLELHSIVFFLGMHFLLGFVVAWLAFLSMRTIFSGVLGPGIFRFSLLVALCCAVVSHILEDYWLQWF